MPLLPQAGYVSDLGARAIALAHDKLSWVETYVEGSSRSVKCKWPSGRRPLPEERCSVQRTVKQLAELSCFVH